MRSATFKFRVRSRHYVVTTGPDPHGDVHFLEASVCGDMSCNKEVSFSLTGATMGGSVVAGSRDAVTISAEGATTLTYFASDHAGNQETAKRLIVKIDKTPPMITGSRTPGANSFGWNNTDVAVSFTCSDGLSGIESCGPTSQVVSPEGADQSRSGTAVDRAGNSASATVSGINIDKTPPLIAGLPAPGCTLWPPNHRLVQVATVTANDGLSGLAPDFPVLTGSSTEPESGLGDGDMAPDIVITGGTAQLRAERSGNGTGRLYTLTASASDLAGNQAMATAACAVSHDLAKKK